MRLPERHHDFVVHRALRPGLSEPPPQPVVAVVEFRHIRHDALQIDAHQLLVLLAELEHHFDRRLLPRRLVQSLRRRIVLARKARTPMSPIAVPGEILRGKFDPNSLARTSSALSTRNEALAIV